MRDLDSRPAPSVPRAALLPRRLPKPVSLLAALAVLLCGVLAGCGTQSQAPQELSLVRAEAGAVSAVMGHGRTAEAEDPVQDWVDERGRRWDDNWRASFYTPFALFAWAYDDSTVDRWYGLGFVWFLLRLVLALFLLTLDLAFSVVFLFGATGYVFFGSSGRNFGYGVATLLVLLIVGSAVRNS